MDASKLDPIMEENSRPVKKVAEEKEDALGAILHLPPSKVLLFFLVLSRFLGRTVKKSTLYVYGVYNGRGVWTK